MPSNEPSLLAPWKEMVGFDVFMFSLSCDIYCDRQQDFDSRATRCFCHICSS